MSEFIRVGVLSNWCDARSLCELFNRMTTEGTSSLKRGSHPTNRASVASMTAMCEDHYLTPYPAELYAHIQ
jgi:hypothetical protein